MKNLKLLTILSIALFLLLDWVAFGDIEALLGTILVLGATIVSCVKPNKEKLI